MSGRYRSFQWSRKTMSSVSTSYFFFSCGMMSWDAPTTTVTCNSAPSVPVPTGVKEPAPPGRPGKPTDSFSAVLGTQSPLCPSLCGGFLL